MRQHDTYRSVRRIEWKAVRKFHDGNFPWVNFNSSLPKYRLGTLPAPLLPDTGSRSKYTPHIGKKERGRYAVA